MRIPGTTTATLTMTSRAAVRKRFCSVTSWIQGTLHVELALKAKGLLMLRESGFETAPDPELKAVFDELAYLERSIGKTGRLAILPFVHPGERDRWQLTLLGAGRSRPG